MGFVSRFFVTYVGPLEERADGPKGRNFVNGEEQQVTHQEYAYFATRTKSWTVRSEEVEEGEDAAAAEIAAEEALEATADDEGESESEEGSPAEASGSEDAASVDAPEATPEAAAPETSPEEAPPEVAPPEATPEATPEVPVEGEEAAASVGDEAPE